MKNILYILTMFMLLFSEASSKTNFRFDNSMKLYVKVDSLFNLYQRSNDNKLKEDIVDYLLDSICPHRLYIESMIHEHLLDNPTPYQEKRILDLIVEKKEFEYFSTLDRTKYDPEKYILANWNDSIRTVIRNYYLELKANDFHRDEKLFEEYKRGTHIDSEEAKRRKLNYEFLLLNMHDDMIIDSILERMERNLIEQDSLILNCNYDNNYFEEVYPNKDRFVLHSIKGFKDRKREIYDKLFYLAIKYPNKYVYQDWISTGEYRYIQFSYYIFTLFSKTIKGFPDINGLDDSYKDGPWDRALCTYREEKLEEILNWCKQHQYNYEFKDKGKDNK